MIQTYYALWLLHLEEYLEERGVNPGTLRG
jgi:hypothetical protein